MSQAYRSMAFAKDLPNGSTVGQLRVSEDQLHFTAENTARTVDLHRLTLRQDGHGGKEVFLNHPELPGWELLLLEPALLKEPSLQKVPGLANTALNAHKLQKKNASAVRVLLWIPLMLLLLIVLGVMAVKPIGRFAANRITIEQEAALGDTIWDIYKSKQAVSPEPELKAKLDKVVARLEPVAKASGYKFQFHIIEDPSINAFALPGGHIAVHTGLLKLAPSPEHVAGVIGHEMAHITKRHGLQKIVQQAGLAIVFAVLAGDLGGLATVAEELNGQAYSRDAEREADKVGWDYLIQARVHPKAMIEMFELMKEKGLELSGLANLVSTHPTTQERIDTLTGWLKELPAGFTAEPL